MDADRLIRQVLHNCHVSDAQHAGLYSICGLALRLRDLFKWEHRLPPWIEKDASEVLNWIGERESLWESLGDAEYKPIRIDGRTYDPFDAVGINASLDGSGLYYSAGYAHSMKPSFLLAEIHKHTSRNGCRVVQLARELARDLLTLPAYSQNGCIVLRREATLLYLWDQIVYIKPSGRPWILRCAAWAWPTAG